MTKETLKNRLTKKIKQQTKTLFGKHIIFY